MFIRVDIYNNSRNGISLHRKMHVVLPKEMVKLVPSTRLLREQEWRAMGVQQSQGWVHYMIHKPEPHILLFKRKITSPPPEN
ncbi:cyclin-dependent kinase subunit 30A isoform X1 [Megachile rotundata]|uniref:cyclin-dependent kinase subunit 30A isoform X1 n=1 Tax=Megachile rotundata TaxID=143995 RepID=UPI003FD0B57B